MQKVAVASAIPEQHERQVVLSCVTQADHRSMAVARAAGVVVDLKVSRGTIVHAGDVVASLSDEGRQAALKQANALLDQRRAEYDANKRLIDRGNEPRNNLPGLEAGVATAQAAVAAAMADLDRAQVRSPVDGMVDSVPVQLGQALLPGGEVAEIIGPDPMLAVGYIGERQRGLLKLGEKATMRFIDGSTVDGTINFVALGGDKATRTYRVEARMANPDSIVADGVSCEMVVNMDPIEAAAIPRSALIFSDAGELGVRIADEKSQARFVPVKIVDDQLQSVWVTGIDKSARVIVVGQDFVKDGDPVEAVSAAKADLPQEPPA